MKPLLLKHSISIALGVGLSLILTTAQAASTQDNKPKPTASTKKPVQTESTGNIDIHFIHHSNDNDYH